MTLSEAIVFVRPTPPVVAWSLSRSCPAAWCCCKFISRHVATLIYDDLAGIGVWCMVYACCFPRSPSRVTQRCHSATHPQPARPCQPTIARMRAHSRRTRTTKQEELQDRAGSRRQSPLPATLSLFPHLRLLLSCARKSQIDAVVAVLVAAIACDTYDRDSRGGAPDDFLLAWMSASIIDVSPHGAPVCQSPQPGCLCRVVSCRVVSLFPAGKPLSVLWWHDGV